MSLLKQVFESASKEDYDAGMQWYYQAHQYADSLSSKYCINFDKVVGVISALSPSTNWEQNKKDADQVLFVWYAQQYGIDPGFPTCTTYGQNLQKAFVILEAQYPQLLFISPTSGFKTHAFFENILNPDDDSFVTIDRHAAAIITGSPVEYAITAKRYREFADEYRTFAKKVGLLPSQLQAVTWVTYRKQKFGDRYGN